MRQTTTASGSNARGRRHGDGNVCENFIPRDVIRVAVEMNRAYLMMTRTSYAHRTVEKGRRATMLLRWRFLLIVTQLCGSHETKIKLRSMNRMKAARKNTSYGS